MILTYENTERHIPNNVKFLVINGRNSNLKKPCQHTEERSFSEKNIRVTNRQDGNYIKLAQEAYRKHCCKPLGYTKEEGLLASEKL